MCWAVICRAYFGFAILIERTLNKLKYECVNHRSMCNGTIQEYRVNPHEINAKQCPMNSSFYLQLN